jgi:hypothetical protein
MKEGPRVFTMHERDTELVTELPVASYTRFIVFPLPSGDSYEEYLQTVKGRLPSHSLHSVSVDGRGFITGPISDLPLLFPDAAAAP